MLERRAQRGSWRMALPAAITLSRLPALSGVIWLWQGGSVRGALVLYAYLLISDVLDGWLARRFACVTRGGALLDVVTDMAAILGLLVLLAVHGVVPSWLPAVPGVIAGLFLLSLRGATPRYDPIGKHYGTALYVAVGLLLAGVRSAIGHALVWGIVTLSVAVLLSRYVLNFRRRA